MDDRKKHKIFSNEVSKPNAITIKKANAEHNFKKWIKQIANYNSD